MRPRGDGFDALREACARKLGRDRATAEAMARLEGMDFYHCAICNFYHLATPRPPWRTDRRRT